MQYRVSLIIFLLTPVIWPLFITWCLIFWAYRKLVDITLRIKLGDKYGGLMHFSDAFAIFEDQSKCIINTMVLFKSDHETDLVNYTKNCLQKEVFDEPENYPKLSNTLHLYGGYGYWLKNGTRLEECVKIFGPPENGPYDEESLKEIAGNIANSPLPQNNTVAWEFNIGEKPIIVKSGEKKIFYYPAMIRFHHVLGDGTAANAFLMRIYGKNITKNYSDEIFQKQKNKNLENGGNMTYLRETLKQFFITIQLIFYIVFLLFQKRMDLIHWREKDVNALHGQNMSGEKIIVWRAEDSVEFVPMVKRIKNGLPKTTFSHVVLTAVSASITNYFKKKSSKIPDIISAFLTMLLKYPIIDYSKPIPMQNKSTAVLLELPTKSSTSLVKTLKKVQENFQHITYFEAKTNILFLHHIFALFPISMRTSFHDAGSFTTVISNVPGGSRVEAMDGCSIEKVIASPPNIRNIGVSMCILTYDDRFQIGLIVDKNLMSSLKEAQELVDDIFLNIKKLDTETRLMRKSE